MLAADPGLPQLKVACDCNQMRELLSRHLRPLGTPTQRIQQCQLHRVRYCPGNRCVLQYALRVQDPHTGRERTQWVTGRIYANDRAQQTWEKLRNADAGLEIPEELLIFQPVSFITELRMQLQVFPYDRRIRALPSLMHEPPPELREALSCRFGDSVQPSLKPRIEPVCYRAGQRAVLLYEVQADDAAGSQQTRRFYVKLYRDEQGERTHRLLESLGSKAGKDSVAVEAPVAYLTRLRTLIVEEAAATPLRQVLMESGDAATPLRQVARALAQFNQHKISRATYYSHADELADLKHVGRTLQSVCSHLADEVETIIAEIAQKQTAVPPAPTHRDIKPEHVWLDGDRVILIDLDRFALADPVLDPAKLLARLLAMPMLHQVAREPICQAADAFIEEYFVHAPETWRSRLPVKYAIALLHLAAHLFRDQEPNWPEKIEILLQAARESLKHGCCACPLGGR